MNRFCRGLLATVVLGSLALPLAAQPSAPVRLHNELKQINRDYKNGSLTKTQYRTDLVRWHDIRHQMRHDWRHNGGPMRKDQRQYIMNRENHFSQRIHDQRQSPPQ